jgi:hypothetical protein
MEKDLSGGVAVAVVEKEEEELGVVVVCSERIGIGMAGAEIDGVEDVEVAELEAVDGEDNDVMLVVGVAVDVEELNGVLVDREVVDKEVAEGDVIDVEVVDRVVVNERVVDDRVLDGEMVDEVVVNGVVVNRVVVDGTVWLIEWWLGELRLL